MPFVGEPFKHDIFISYSHGDVGQSGVGRLKQYSQELVGELEAELTVLPEIGRELSIFRDEDERPDQGLDPMGPLTDQLKRDIEGSAVLAVLTSPHYLGSEWCRKEREWWLAAQESIELDTSERMCALRIWPTGKIQWPEGLVDCDGHTDTGYRFHDKNSDQPYAWHSPAGTMLAEFKSPLIRLVGDLKRRLTSIRDVLEERRLREASIVKFATGDAETIYLHGRESQRVEFTRVHGQLRAEGYRVVPSDPEPQVPDPKERWNVRTQRARILSSCDAALMLGSDLGDDVVEDVIAIGKDLRGDALQYNKKFLPCGLLDITGSVERNPHWRDTAEMFGVRCLDAKTPPWRNHVQGLMKSAVNA